jgi:RNA polymerase sigma factor (sigma-70 family)
VGFFVVYPYPSDTEVVYPTMMKQVWSSEGSKKYITKAYNREKRKSGIRAMSRAEFLLAVRGEVWLELSENLGEQATSERVAQLLMEFDRRLDAGMAKAREAKAHEPRAEGEEPDAFTHLPERKILARAIRGVVHSDTPRRRRREGYAGDFTEIVHDTKDDKAHEPSTIAELAELAFRAHEALERLDKLDQKILMLHFYDKESQFNIAGRLRMPPQTVNGRLHRALDKLRFTLQGHADR